MSDLEAVASLKEGEEAMAICRARHPILPVGSWRPGRASVRPPVSLKQSIIFLKSDAHTSQAKH